MHIYKRGNVWWYEVVKDGMRHRGSCGTRNRKEAQAFIGQMGVVKHASSREVALKIVDALFPPEKKPGTPVGGMWDAYSRTADAMGLLAPLVARTKERRRNVVNRFLRWLGAKCPAVENVEEIDGPIAGRFAAALAHEKGRNGKPLSAKSRKNILGELGTVWRTLEKVSAGIRNPWTGLNPRDVDGTRGEAFTREQEAAVMAAAAKIGKGWPLACLVARHTGLRYGDVAQLKWSEIDLENGVIRKTPGKTMRHGVKVAIPLAPALKDALVAAAAGKSRDGYVLPLHAQLYGRRSQSAYDVLNFREVLEEAGVDGEGYSFHSWRHTMRSRLAAAGADIETAKRLLGHMNDEMSRHYDHDDHIEESRRAILAAAK